MGFFSKLRNKKDDMGMSDFGKDQNEPMSMHDPMSNPDMGYGNPMDAPLGSPSGSMQQQGPPQMPPGNYSPEAMGFERVQGPSSSSYSGSSHQSVAEINIGKDLELISAKLDAIKAEMDSMSQRLKRLERLAEGDTGNQQKWNY